MHQDTEGIPEPLYPEAAARLLSDALFRLLKDNQGIICRGLNEDGKMVKAGVWKSKGRINIIETKNSKLPFGSFFSMHETESDAIVRGAFTNGEILEL